MTRPSARRALTAAAIALAFCAAGAVTRAADNAAVKLQAMKWDAFKAKLAHAGADKFKLTLVDAWATTCAPCKENFPHLVQMHEKFAAKGLQVISLSLDDTTDDKALAAAREFLAAKQAKFLNVVLDEEFGVNFEKLDVSAIPAVFLYGPDGKELRRFTMDDPNHQFTYDEVEKEVSALLAGKATAAR